MSAYPLRILEKSIPGAAAAVSVVIQVREEGL
jgi:hypothetical protein